MQKAAPIDEISLPCDYHAESVVCNYAQIHPERILELGLVQDDFYDRRHRRLWQLMVNIFLNQPNFDISPGDLYLLLIYQLEDQDRDRSEHHTKGVVESVDPFADWTADRWDPHAIERDINHFVERIKRCVVARRTIDAAQQIAERAYRVPNIDFDVTDASAILSRVAGVPIRHELGINLPI